MKKLIFSTLAALLTCHAQAGLLLEQTMETPSGTNTCIMRIQDNLIRTDIDSDTTTISNTKTGETLTVLHQTKQVMKIKAAPPSTTETPPLPKLEFKDTGAVETINGYECKIISAQMDETKLTYWVAKNYPDYAKIKSIMATLSQSNPAQTSPPELDGMIMKSSTVSPQYLSIMTLKSVRTEDFKPEIFTAPEGYTVLDLAQ